MRKITEAEIASFDEHGYVICRGVLAEDELEHCRSESYRLIDEILGGGLPDMRCSRGPEGVPYYLNYLHANANSFSLRLLAHPFVGDALNRMVGPDFVPCWESLVFKLPSSGSSVPWHRDDKSVDGDERVFNIDFYFDKSNSGNGGLWVVPGSHLLPAEEANALIERGRRDFKLPGAIPTEVEPGDVILHHVKVLHGSEVKESDELRRVVYFDSRAASRNRKYRWFAEDVMRERCRMYQFALYQRRVAPYESDDETFAYLPPSDMPGWEWGEPVDLLGERAPWDG